MTMPTPSPTGTPGTIAPNLGGLSSDLHIPAPSVATTFSSTDPMVPSRTFGTSPGYGNESGALFQSGAAFSDARDSYTAGKGTSPGIDTTRPSSQVYMDVKRMSDQDLEALGTRLVSAGALAPGWTRADIEKEWGTLVGYAADWHTANPTSNLTPEDMIDLYYGSGANGGQPASTVQNYVTSKIDLSDPYTARALISNALQDALGRKPSGKEADDFQAALNAAQTASPTITNQTINTSPANLDPNGMGYKNTQTTVSGGVNANDFAQQYEANNLAQTAEYKHYQAATTYYNALLQGISGPGGPH